MGAADPDNDQNDLTSKASALCMACGLCCDGLIFTHAVLKSNEAASAAELGLSIYLEHDDEEGDYEAFRLPCSCYKNGACTVYAQRPAACCNYQCLLLRRFLQGKQSFAMSLDLIRTARQLIGNIKYQMGDGISSQRLWDQIRAFYEDQADDDPDLEAFRIEVKTLWNFCYYQFDRRVASVPYPDRPK